jgi:hypothetical protein
MHSFCIEALFSQLKRKVCMRNTLEEISLYVLGVVTFHVSIYSLVDPRSVLQCSVFSR